MVIDQLDVQNNLPKRSSYPEKSRWPPLRSAFSSLARKALLIRHIVQAFSSGSLGFRMRPSCRRFPGSAVNVHPYLRDLSVPTMPSADFCHTVKVDCSPFSQTVSRKRLVLAYDRPPGVRPRNFPCVDAGFIKHIPIADGGLRGHVPTRPGCTTPHIRFLFVAPHLWIGLPSDPASRRRPCPSPNLRLREYLV